MLSIHVSMLLARELLLSLVPYVKFEMYVVESVITITKAIVTLFPSVVVVVIFDIRASFPFIFVSFEKLINEVSE